jgi:predicted O-methyltransferase YrrM
MNYFLRIYYFVIHFVTARNTRGFGVHSPYLFDFVRYVISEKNPFYIFAEIEKQRSKLLNDNTIIIKSDFGTGASKQFKVCDIASKSICSPRKGQLLCRIVNYLKLNNVLELGTSFGISTAYIASLSNTRKCVTLEGCENTASIARQTFSALNLSNIEVITGNIDNTIQNALNKLSIIDFVYIDANHSLDATIRYFELIQPGLSEKAVVVFDDIYWSKDMKLAWENIKSNAKVTSTFDMYHFGIAFFNPDLKAKNYKLRF